ncbi:MAG TPA: hypothetical protein ENI80_07110 [Acidiferrobacteraceae bacterium]|nr:hypothetical protein [Acidiferrobacteraceae bacterium]
MKTCNLVRTLILLLSFIFVHGTEAQDYKTQQKRNTLIKGPLVDIKYKLKDPLYKETIKFEGAKHKELTGKAAGLPLSALPGARFITSQELRRTANPIETGLLLLDMDFVPTDLPQRLKKEGYKLTKSGRLLDKDKQPVLMVMRAHVYALYGDNKAAKQQGIQWSKTVDYLVPSANAGNPYPLRCATWAWRKTYNGGFCRSITAQTWVDAWGPSADGSCGADRPHTRIEYIETRAHVSGAEDRDTCRNCDSEYSRDYWNIGCFWPAFGGGMTSHYAHVRDGALRGTATATSR